VALPSPHNLIPCGHWARSMFPFLLRLHLRSLSLSFSYLGDNGATPSFSPWYTDNNHVLVRYLGILPRSLLSTFIFWVRYQIHDKIEIMKSFMLLDTFGSFSFTCTAMLYCIEQHSAAVRKRNKCYLVVLRDLRF
jgi:hypothetical protein